MDCHESDGVYGAQETAELPFIPLLLQPRPPGLRNSASSLHHEPPCGRPHFPTAQAGLVSKFGEPGLPAAPPSTTPPGPAQPAPWTLQGTGSHLASSLPTSTGFPLFSDSGLKGALGARLMAGLVLCLLPLASLGVTRPAPFRPCDPTAPATPASESPEQQAGFPPCSRVTR